MIIFHVLHKSKGYRRYFMQLRCLLDYKHVSYVGTVMNVVRTTLFIYCLGTKFVQSASYCLSKLSQFHLDLDNSTVYPECLFIYTRC